MPIRLTLAYGERLVTERFDAGSQIRKDIVLLCAFWQKLNEIEADTLQLQRSQFFRVIQEIKSASGRLLEDNALESADGLKFHERFELGFLAAVITACGGAIESTLAKLTNKSATSRKKDVEDETEKKNAARSLREKVENLKNAQILFLIGSGPNEYVTSFLRDIASATMAILGSKGMQFERGYEFSAKFIEEATSQLAIWLASKSKMAKWISEYLNFQHQQEWAARVSDDVKSIQQALVHWLQPTSETAIKRAEAWGKYKSSLLELPDLKETMFAEQFGVRKVFVQPVARYKVVGMGLEDGAEVPDVANLIAGLISERVPGDELILLCGGPGSGKSTLCRIMASELASNPKIHPVFMRLRRLQDGQDIPSFVEAHLQKEGIIDKFSDLADVSNLVLILDGFDELVMASRSRLREFFNTLREDLMSGPLRNSKAIVSGRDTLFPNGAGLPSGSHVISLRPFDKARITVWGEKWRALHQTARGKSFQPEIFFDEKSNQESSKASPLHHLASWPLTLHLVARVHDSGALDLTKAAQRKIEKAVLYKSIVTQTALRQQEQSHGKGRLLPEQMREFVQAISWEMYSTSRDALDYNEGLPLLKSIYPDASEVELSEFADVAIVNQPELTKGDEGGFEFVHKSFSEYFVAEKFALAIEKASFKAQDYASETLTWRMSSKEAIGELSSLLAIRVVTAEVQEMLEPMLADFKSFLDTPRGGKAAVSEFLDKLKTKKTRMEELISDYMSGAFQTEVVERVRGSKIVKNEREIHANFSVGLLITACAISTRLSDLRVKAHNQSDAVSITDGRLWKLISIMQAGDIQIDTTLAERCLNPIRVGTDSDAVEVPYPPIPTRLLRGVRGVVFPMDVAIRASLDLSATLMIDNLFVRFLTRRGGKERILELESRDYRRFAPSLDMAMSEVLEILNHVGIMPLRSDMGEWRDDRPFQYIQRGMEELVHRIAQVADEVAREDSEEFYRYLREYTYRLGRGPGGYGLHGLIDKLEYLIDHYRTQRRS